MKLLITENEFKKLFNLVFNETDLYEDDQDYLFIEYNQDTFPPLFPTIKFTYTLGDYERTITFIEDDSPLYPDRFNFNFTDYYPDPDPTKKADYRVLVDGKSVEFNNILLKQLENKIHKYINKDWNLYK